MMGLDSALLILLAEGLLVSLLLVFGVFFYGRVRNNNEINEIDDFVNKLTEQEALKSRLLESMLLESCGLDQQTAGHVLKEVLASERQLLQRVVQMFLQRNPSLLPEIDQMISNLSDPFCKLLIDINAANDHALREIKTGGVTPAHNDPLDAKLAGLERINQQLTRQLGTAMKTIDEMTAEYTRVFSGSQTALELENSSKKMIQVFQAAEDQLKNNATDWDL